MHDIIEGCVYHRVKVIAPRRFKVDVFRGGRMRFDGDDPVFFGGRRVATLYRPTEAMANGAGVEYGFVTATGAKFRGVTGPKYGRSLRAA